MKANLFAASLLFLTCPVFAQGNFDDVEIKTTKLTGGIYMLEGSGGNIGLSVGEDGAFLIDDQFPPLSDKILAAIKEVTDNPVEFVLNTHYHGDHTSGNYVFGNNGATIVAHDNVRVRLSQGDDAYPDYALPTLTFSETATFHRNGEEIYVFHPDNAHTDGDAIVHFRNSNVIHMGDVFFSGLFPYIDVDGGGTIDGYIDALEQSIKLADDNTKIIPGHGSLSSKEDMARTIAMLKDVRNRVQALIDSGLSEEEAVAADPLADLKDEWSWGFINEERMTRAAYKSLAGK